MIIIGFQNDTFKPEKIKITYNPIIKKKKKKIE